jgi:hypothetical protein
MYGSTDMSCSTGINGQKTPRGECPRRFRLSMLSRMMPNPPRCRLLDWLQVSTSTGTDSMLMDIHRYTTVILAPSTRRLSVLTEVDDAAVNVGSWPNDAKPAAMSFAGLAASVDIDWYGLDVDGYPPLYHGDPGAVDAKTGYLTVRRSAPWHRLP